MTPVGTTAKSRKWQRVDGIDILRGLAIFLVLMNHVNMRLRGAKVPYTTGLPEQLVDSLVWNGQRGVQIFFAISGFLITSTALRRWGSLSKVSVRDFYRLRFARIAPLLFLLLLILSALHFGHVKNFVVQPKTGGLGRALVAAFTFHVNVLEAQRGYLPANWDILWSLSVEEMFYLFFPLVCWALGGGRWLIAFLLLFVVVGPFGRTILAQGNEVWYEYSYLGGMDAIALGCLTGLLVSRQEFSRRLLWSFGTAGAAVVIFSLCFSLQANAWGLERSGLAMTILALGTCMLIAAASETQWRGPGIFVPVLKLGQSSYEVYLTHMFVVFALFTLFLYFGRPMFGVPILFVTVIVISGLAGQTVARFYSEPMNRLLRHQEVGEGSRVSMRPEAML